ncbi:hypothetical protein HUU05_14645 [candidate division KSB1 bacterium]|nr:hypothetical protein [candidate division KSB1 bacterium]
MAEFFCSGEYAITKRGVLWYCQACGHATALNIERQVAQTNAKNLESVFGRLVLEK